MKKRPAKKSSVGKKEPRTDLADKTLHHSEYNFDAVALMDADAARFYEYARESLGIRDAVKRLSDAICAIESAHSESLFWHEPYIGDPQPGSPDRQACVIGLFTSDDDIIPKEEVTFSAPRNRDPEEFMAEVSALARTPSFPETPWLCIGSQEEKQILIATLADRGLPPLPPLLLSETQPNTKLYSFLFRVQEHFQQPNSDAIIRGEFQMDLEGDTREMYEQLEAFVRQMREHHSVTPPKATGGRPTSPQPRLNQLGAMRMLWFKGTIKAAVKEYGLYGNRWDYVDACRDACEYFNEYFALSDNERPIHDPPLRPAKKT